MKDYTEIRKILEILPHGEEALVVDRIVELIPGEKAVGMTVFDRNAFPGHFPSPVGRFAPITTLLEVAYQVGQITVCSLPGMRKKVLLGFKYDETRVRHSVFSGGEFTVHAEVVRISSNYSRGHVKVKGYCNNKLVLESGFWYKVRR